MKNTFAIGWIALSALLLSSCSTTSPGGTTEVPEGIPTTATFSLSQTGPQSYAGGTEAATTEESAIKNATVYIFSNKTLATIVTFSSSTMTQQINTTTGKKQLFACVNMNDKLPAGITVGMDLDAFKKSYEQLTDATSLSDMTNSAKGFWMTNVEKDAPEVTVTQTSDSNNFTINVGRAVAKVKCSLRTDAQINGGTLTDIKYKVMNNPKKMYLMPVYEGADYTGPGLLTPYYTATYVANGAVGNQVSSGSYFGGSDVTIGNSTYAVENSSQVTTMGKLTYLQVRGKFTPSGTPTGGGTLAANGDFWRMATTDAGGKITGYLNGWYATAPTAGAGQKAIKYTGGISYYGIWLANNQLTVSSLKYTVPRNTCFQVTIDAVAGPGSGTEGDVTPDPSQPIETDVNMTASVTVMAWNVVDQHTGI